LIVCAVSDTIKSAVVPVLGNVNVLLLAPTPVAHCRANLSGVELITNGDDEFNVRATKEGLADVCKFCVIVHVSVDPIKDALQPFAFEIITDCNCFDAVDATNAVAVNPESIKLANVGVPVVVRFCVIVNVNVDPLNDALQPLALLIVTDCVAFDASVANNLVAVNAFSIGADPNVFTPLMVCADSLITNMHGVVMRGNVIKVLTTPLPLPQIKFHASPDAALIVNGDDELIVNPANDGLPDVCKSCVIVHVNVDPLNEVLHPFALLKVTDCKRDDAFVDTNFDADNDISVVDLVNIDSHEMAFADINVSDVIVCTSMVFELTSDVAIAPAVTVPENTGDESTPIDIVPAPFVIVMLDASVNVAATGAAAVDPISTWPFVKPIESR